MLAETKLRYGIQLGDEVLSELAKLGPLHKSSVEYAEFAVLKAQGVPSILVETAFLSNPKEENRLARLAPSSAPCQRHFHGHSNRRAQRPLHSQANIRTPAAGSYDPAAFLALNDRHDMPLPEAPRKRGTILDASAYGKKTADVSTKPTTKTAALKTAAKTKTAATEVKETTRAAVKTAPKTTAKKAAKPSKTVKKTAEATIVATPEGTTAHEKATNTARLRSPRSSSTGQMARIFVLDTNVLLHDPTCLFRFQEHDVYLPMVTLEELDNHKTGTTDIARNARQVSRTIDRLIESGTGPIQDGVELAVLGNKEARGKLYFQDFGFNPRELPAGLPHDKADNMILAVVRALPELFPNKHVVLVSKDINIRIKATAMGLTAEDYFNDKTIDDADLIFTGCASVTPDFWEKQTHNLKSWQSDGSVWYSFEGPLAMSLSVNQFVATTDGSFVGQVKSVAQGVATLCTIKDYLQPRNAVWGVHARNMEQSLALNLLMNPDIDFVTLLGQAGTGKTLITLAAALAQTLEDRRFSEIIFTRATVSVGEEIGFLPGTEEEKMTPWMGALEDNLEVLNKADRGAGSWGRSAAADIIRSRIRIKSMSFMRGRTFLNKFVIIDEAQNLSPKQMKTLITRAGPGTKIVCMGNIAQIDTPYLTEGSSGLTYVVEKFRGWSHAGHITLQRGERSRLADYASEVL